MQLIFLVIAFACFVIATTRVAGDPVSGQLQSAGLAFMVAAQIPALT